jgi:hypothetical protein
MHIAHRERCANHACLHSQLRSLVGKAAFYLKEYQQVGDNELGGWCC